MIDAQDYFNRIRGIWKPFSRKHRVIPFCTPVFDRPTAMVIGKNHSTFAPGDPSTVEAIAEQYAFSVPTVNTFIKHEHSFAAGLRRACAVAGIVIDETWMGTNRCAVQTDAHGIASLQRVKQFRECQRAMDELLKELVSAIRPVNLLLAGAYAVELYYPDRGLPVSDLPCLTIGSGSRSTKVIPIHHPSRGTARAKIVTKLAECFVKLPHQASTQTSRPLTTS